ncbi:MAG TPA: M20/M25/M40 family metallo-hydrolase [Isosphaeraceae bacterium]|nr:M20/M25/M40 family metallo-hydrolase [Isosphaeraceae bacterium]
MTGTSRGRPARGRRLPRLATVVFIAAVSGTALVFQRPPRALPTDSPPEVFAAGRALRHVQAIAQDPHPLGSAAEEPVRAYILAELKALGLEPEIQQPRDARPPGPEARSDPSRRDVRNILARRRGSGPPSKKAVLLSAHYDSVTRGPGAGDDASGVAAILETLRALQAGPPLERDLIVLINEGEEAGLLGADVFAEDHPWAKDVGVVLNLDARGNAGPSYMFETSDGNGWLIEQLALALPHPMATSLTMAVYRLLPNDTDLTIYKRHGMAGLNFAFVEGLSYYHSPEDIPANLDPRTLQHQGENLLAMTRHLGRLDLDDVRRGDVVYTSLLQQLVVIYPQTWVLPLMGGAVLAYVGVMMLGIARGRIRRSEVVAGFGIFLLAMLAAVLAVGGLWSVLSDRLYRMGVIVFRPDLGHGSGMLVSRFDIALLTGFAVLAVGIVVVIFVGSGRRWSLEGLGLGVLGWWLAVTVAASVWLPGASYAFVWPLLAILAGQAVAFTVTQGGIIALLASWLGAVPLLVIHLMILPGIFHGLNLRMAGPLMIPVVLVAAALVPLASQVLNRR